MKKEGLLLIVLPIVMVFIGLFAGFYFGIYKTAVAVAGCEVEKSLIAPSPIVTSSVYDEEKHELELTVANPGSMPISLIDKTLVLKPKNAKATLLMASIPLGVTIPAYKEVTFTSKLWQAGSGFVVGDVVETTLTYSLPVSKDLYFVVHRFKKSSDVNSKGQAKNAFGDNKDVEKKYNEKHQK